MKPAQIKRFIRKTPLYTLATYGREIVFLRRKYHERLSSLLKKYPLIISEGDPTIPLIIRKAEAYKDLLRKMTPIIDDDGIFSGHRSIYRFPSYRQGEENLLTAFGNLTPDYRVILEKGITGIQNEVRSLSAAAPDEKQKDLFKAVCIVCESISEHSLAYAERLEQEAAKCSKAEQTAIYEEKAKLCRKVPMQPAASFKEALQSIYFTNLMIWAEGHSLVGLGRMDRYLWPYYKRDIESGLMSRDEAYELLVQLWRKLALELKEKSNILTGDTGQAIVLGGNGADNELTGLIMKVARDTRQIDPKIVLRVHDRTPETVWQGSMELLAAGGGMPLYASDRIIIPALERYGYRKEDAEEYGVSACWEPLITGKSFEINNVSCINFMKVMQEALNTRTTSAGGGENVTERGGLQACQDFQSFLGHVKKLIAACVEERAMLVNGLRYEPAPVLSMLTEGCLTKGRDISEGGARYNNTGFLSAGFVNMVNALICIKKIVYEQKLLNAERLIEILKKDYEGAEEWRQYFINRVPKFGNDVDEVDALARELAAFFADECNKHRNRFGGRFKAGLGGAGTYITGAREAAASADGRKSGETLADNFSPVPGTEKAGMTAVVNSVAKVDFNKVFNGSVLDLKLSPSFLSDEESKKKFTQLLKKMMLKCEEVQFNVVDTAVLKDAQLHPEKHRDLIVRVWGFSAYFVDLPTEYQDQIVKRYEHCA